MFLVDDSALLAMLKEDVPFGDLTTRSLAFGRSRGHIVFTARDPMVVCATEEAARIFELLGCAVDLSSQSGDGKAPGDLLLAAGGSAEALFTGWKVAQTLVEWASGVATAAAAIVAAAQAVNPAVTIACTRKAIPGTRALSFKAITAGGATIHRSGLSDTVLVFPEHRAFDTGCLKRQLSRLRASCPEKCIVVEVTTQEDALRAAEWGAGVVQLEKFTPDAVAAVVAAVGPDCPARIAAAGGITPSNAAAYAASGAHVLVTSSPYYAKPADVQVSLNPASAG